MITKESSDPLFRDNLKRVLEQEKDDRQAPSKMTEKQRVSFQRQLETRVKKLDKEGKLENYNVEYFYCPDLNFGKIFRMDTTISDAFLDADDNYGLDLQRPTLLVFSRPRDNVYVMLHEAPYFVSYISTIIYTKASDMRVVICRIEDFLNVAD